MIIYRLLGLVLVCSPSSYRTVQVIVGLCGVSLAALVAGLALTPVGLRAAQGATLGVAALLVGFIAETVVVWLGIPSGGGVLYRARWLDLRACRK